MYLTLLHTPLNGDDLLYRGYACHLKRGKGRWHRCRLLRPELFRAQTRLVTEPQPHHLEEEIWLLLTMDPLLLEVSTFDLLTGSVEGNLIITYNTMITNDMKHG